MSRTYAGDLIVAGSGVAGLAAALAAAERGARVHLLTAGAPLAGSSPRAQGGVAAAVGEDDTPELHAQDTFAVGAGLNDAEAVEVLVEEGSRIMRALLHEGVPFDTGPAGPELGLEAGHARRRILHAGGATGQMLTSALLERALAHPLITIHTGAPAGGLLWDTRAQGSAPASSPAPQQRGAGETSRLPVAGGRITGLTSGDRRFVGRAVVLATGGYGALWGRTTNAPENTGQGLALAWEAGASLADLEFVQFHPTALDLPGHPAFLLSEALRGEGAWVVNAAGEPVCDPLLPRDVVARAIHRYRRQQGPVFLSLRHLDAERIRARFATIAAQLAEWGLDLAADLLPIAPAAHYCMGGVRTDVEGRTDVPGLYAAGEVTCTGAQGANRLASNSLLECLVFGARAAVAALSDTTAARAVWEVEELGGGDLSLGPQLPLPQAGAGDVPALMDRYCSVERTAEGLQTLLAALDAGGPAWLPRLVAQAALLRVESRGAHYRADFPETSPAWRGRIHWRKGAPPALEPVTGGHPVSGIPHPEGEPAALSAR